VGRLARVSFDGSDAGEPEPLATVGGVEILRTGEIDPDQVRRRLDERREKLRAEVERGKSKLANKGFVSKAPAEVVESERQKLAAYRAELEELGELS
jgi:valyl-tRNA synthetase